jgi:hypothetical protein
MATKTITLEIDAYEKLKRAKQSPRESFSSVVRRARFDEGQTTIGQLLAELEYRAGAGAVNFDDGELDALEAAQRSPRYSESEWD